MRFIDGPEELKPARRPRILDADFQYTPAVKTDLWVSMEKYKEMVKNEANARKVSAKEKNTSQHSRVGKVLSGQQNGNSKRLTVVATGGQS